MKVTRSISLLNNWFVFITSLFVFTTLGCSIDSFDPTENYNFVRFSLLVNSNGQIISKPNSSSNIEESVTYTHRSLSKVTIPVLLSTKPLDKAVTLKFQVSNSGNYTDYSISPQNNQLTFQPDQLKDSIVITFNSRWPVQDAGSINLNLLSIDDPSLSIGWSRQLKRMDKVTINLGDLSKTNYYFDKTTYGIEGRVNEELDIPLLFSQPISKKDLGTFNFISSAFVPISDCEGEGGTFQYSLTPQPFVDGAQVIIYKLKILETTSLPSKLQLKLNSGLIDFLPSGISTTDISKPLIDNRSGDPAANWYDVADGLYRHYGKAWYKDPTTGLCRWSTFNTFVKPVTVPSNSPFNNGKGYHKYRVGYVSPNLPIGTNPFDLRRFYNGASVNSPGYNIPEALEFFPNPSNANKGLVSIVAQTLTYIRTSDAKTVNIPICGSGDYEYDPIIKQWKMYIELHFDESAIGGSKDAIKPMYLYSNNLNGTNPEDLTIPCPLRIDI
jgi:hypothetical protein